MKATRRSEPARVLERLLEQCLDGAAGYRLAAEEVRAPGWLRQLLSTNAAQREEMANVLADALLEIGKTEPRHGSMRGAVHRGLIEALNAFAPDAPHAVRSILRECERGERSTVEAFSHALGRALPDDIHRIIQSQFGRLLEANARLRGAVAALDESSVTHP